MRAIEEWVASIEGALAVSQQQQQEARSTAHLDSSPGSQRHSSVTSTDYPAGGRTEVVVDEHHREDPQQASLSTEEKDQIGRAWYF